jgi:hypothetical protein
MPVTQDQARTLAQLAVDCRPHGARRWDIQGVYAAIGKVKDRHLADVVLAVIRAADDRSADTPGVINAPGSLHWKERGTDRPTPTTGKYDAATHCGTCSQPEHICRRIAAGHDDGHEFVPAARLAAHVTSLGIDVKRTVLGLKEVGAEAPAPKPEPVLEEPDVPDSYLATRAQLRANTCRHGTPICAECRAANAKKTEDAMTGVGEERES